LVNNMIRPITDNYIFMNICDKLDDVPDCKMSKTKLYIYMISGQYNQKTFTFAGYDKDIMTGCTVITIDYNINGNLTLFVVFLWINPHYRKLWKDYMKFIEGKAKEYHCQKISFTTTRNEKAIDRQMGKYNYRKVYSVIEKEVV